jgi:hypothetical protein
MQGMAEAAHGVTEVAVVGGAAADGRQNKSKPKEEKTKGRKQKRGGGRRSTRQPQ